MINPLRWVQTETSWTLFYGPIRVRSIIKADFGDRPWMVMLDEKIRSFLTLEDAKKALEERVRQWIEVGGKVL